MQLRKTFGGQFLAVALLKINDIIFHLQSHDLLKRHIVDCRLHRYFLKLPNSQWIKISSPSFFQAEVTFLLVNPLTRIFFHVFQPTMWKRYFQNSLRVRLDNLWSHDGPMSTSMIILNTSLGSCESRTTKLY
ncbi:hypothetical protein AVEN_118302-1 [Araneus ventricosus]|uniref:Uncharacterized protein n=1 Tax=Araneus ventricosus TaxID=182803 RepID=A0A4Y2LD72_ARAVE|nr:hypothetical protein AVEN_118302-1 [Araneus ventricosus]